MLWIVTASLVRVIKWQGLPYSECTWELDKDIQPHGGPRAILEWKVG